MAAPCCGAATIRCRLLKRRSSTARPRMHSSAVVVPVVIALAGRGGVTGRDALMGLLAGYDLAARVLEGAGGYRAHNDLGWHSTGTCGSFGAAAAAARILRLDSQSFADALGIAGTFTGG